MTRSARRSFFLAAAALLLAGPAHAETVTGSGRMATESRPVSGFNAIGIAVPGKVQLTQGDSESLSITADDNILPLIETLVENGSLRIRFKREHNFNVNRATIRIALAAKTVESLSIGGSGDVTAGPLRARKLAVNIGGSGNVGIESVAAGEVAVRIGGSGDVAIHGGRTQSLDASIGGSGELKAPKLESQRARVTVAGSGDAAVWARETLSVSVAGSGSVRYYGDPKVQRAIVGSGDVRRAGASPT